METCCSFGELWKEGRCQETNLIAKREVKAELVATYMLESRIPADVTIDVYLQVLQSLTNIEAIHKRDRLVVFS